MRDHNLSSIFAAEDRQRIQRGHSLERREEFEVLTLVGSSYPQPRAILCSDERRCARY